MDFLTDWLTDWLKELLIDGIMGNLSGLFDSVNANVGEIAAQVGTTPAAWNAGVFSLIRQLSETVVLPIAGLILTFVATYELIQMLIDRNNLHDLDYWIFFKWIFKTGAAILILSNTFNIVMAVFDVSQSVITRAAGLVQGSTDVTADMLATLETTLEGMDIGPLLGLFMQSLLIVKTTGRQKSIAASGVDAGQHGHAKQRDDGDRDEPLPAAQPATQRIFGKYRRNARSSTAAIVEVPPFHRMFHRLFHESPRLFHGAFHRVSCSEHRQSPTIRYRRWAAALR